MYIHLERCMKKASTNIDCPIKNIDIQINIDSLNTIYASILSEKILLFRYTHRPSTFPYRRATINMN